MKIISDIREFFWPLLEKSNLPEPEIVNQEDISVSTNHLGITLEYALSCYQEENERKKTVEGKSSLFIGTISVITSVVIGVTSVLVKSDIFSPTIPILLFLLFILTVYMARTVWFSIKALERKSYYSLSINDFLISNSDDLYYKKLIAEITNKIRKNSTTINSKVDNMTMAQEYFKRAIVIVVLYAFVVFLIFLPKSGFNFSHIIKNIIELFNSIKLNGWNIVILYTLTITSIVLSIRNTLKKK